MIYTSPYPSLNARFAAVPQLVRHVAERSPHHPAIVDASSRAVVTYVALAGQEAAAGFRRALACLREITDPYQ
jgi:hypothetical protein